MTDAGREAAGVASGRHAARARSALPGRRGDIQGLRAVAVGLVVLAHAGIPMLAGGYVGVDVFFVISGFLITGLLLRESERGRISISGFYARRARRILPAATLVLVCTVVFAALREPVTRVHEIATDAVWSAVFLANVHFAEIGDDYFAAGSASPVRHYWSLAVEEQFYLVWPLVIGGLAAVRATRRGRWVAVTGILVASLGWSIVTTSTTPVAAYFSTPARAYELALGALVAVLAPRLARLGGRQRRLLGTVGLALVAAAALTFDEATAVPGWAALVPTLGAAAVLAAGTGTDAEPGGLGRLLTLRPVRYVGDISFSIYLVHWPVLVLGGQGPGSDRTVPGLAALLLLTLLLSVACYHLVEVPFQHGRVPLSRDRSALVLWPVALLVVLVATVGARQYGDAELARAEAQADRFYAEHPEALDKADPEKVQDAVRRAVDLARSGAPLPGDLDNLARLKGDIWQKKGYCWIDWEEVETRDCPVGDTNAARTVVVYGDSHAGMWLPALDRIGREEHFRIIPFVKVGCAPYDVVQTHVGKDFPTCPAFREWALGRIAQIKPDAVVLGHRGLLFMDPPAGVSREDAWSDGVRRSVEQVAGLTPVVKVLGDIPALPWDPRECLTARDATLDSCTAPLEGDEVLGNRLTKEALRGTGADFVGVTDLICDQRRCPLVIGRTVVFRDDAHLSVTWTMLLVNELATRLRLFG